MICKFKMWPCRRRRTSSKIKGKGQNKCKKNRKEKQKGREFLRRERERDTDKSGHASKERAFETDVESFDNLQKERGRRWNKG